MDLHYNLLFNYILQLQIHHNKTIFEKTVFYIFLTKIELFLLLYKILLFFKSSRDRCKMQSSSASSTSTPRPSWAETVNGATRNNGTSPTTSSVGQQTAVRTVSVDVNGKRVVYKNGRKVRSSSRTPSPPSVEAATTSQEKQTNSGAAASADTVSGQHSGSAARAIPLGVNPEETTDLVDTTQVKLELKPCSWCARGKCATHQKPENAFSLASNEETIPVVPVQPPQPEPQRASIEGPTVDKHEVVLGDFLEAQGYGASHSGPEPAPESVSEPVRHGPATPLSKEERRQAKAEQAKAGKTGKPKAKKPQAEQHQPQAKQEPANWREPNATARFQTSPCENGETCSFLLNGDRCIFYHTREEIAAARATFIESTTLCDIGSRDACKAFFTDSPYSGKAEKGCRHWHFCDVGLPYGLTGMQVFEARGIPTVVPDKYVNTTYVQRNAMRNAEQQSAFVPPPPPVMLVEIPILPCNCGECEFCLDEIEAAIDEAEAAEAEEEAAEAEDEADAFDEWFEASTDETGDALAHMMEDGDEFAKSVCHATHPMVCPHCGSHFFPWEGSDIEYICCLGPKTTEHERAAELDDDDEWC